MVSVKFTGRCCHSLAVATLLSLAVASGPGVGATAPTEASPLEAAATFAGGCFWCMEPPFDRIEGVIATTSGYTGGEVPNPSYEQVSSGGTGHAEAVRVIYDPEKVSYERLLEVFWRNIDPLAFGRQFCDVGAQYRSVIFVHSEAQRRLAQASKRQVEARFESPVATEVVPVGPFYPAEAYHQDYYEKNPLRYKLYRWRCGRDQRLDELWGTDRSDVQSAR
jgi:peptide-methionine (S)-S-oxide reductase